MPDLLFPSLSPAIIIDYLQTNRFGKKLICLESIDSTNTECKRRAHLYPEGTVILSEVQTAGKGRLGREWISPKGKGIWMSILLKPSFPSDKIPQLTLVGAAAVCLALENCDPTLSGKLQIKWPNDIFLDHRKIGGVLTEMQVSGGKVHSVVLGIGLNVNLVKDDFSDDLLKAASSLRLQTGRKYEREPLVAEILNCLEILYFRFLDEGQLGKSLEICRQRSAVIGRKVILLDNAHSQEADVIDLGPQGELIVRLPNGTIKSIVSGEISLRMP